MEKWNDRVVRLMREKGLSQRAVARLLNVSTGTVNGWSSGRTKKIRMDFLQPLAKILNVSPLYIMRGDNVDKTLEIITPDKDVPSEIEQAHLTSMVAIPKSNLVFECGDGLEPTYIDMDDDPYYYPLSFFQKAQVNPKHCKAFEVLGDSMQPIIHRGDTILVDVSEHQEIQNNRIYAFAIEHSLRVKRLIRKLDKSLIIHSENPDYPDEILSAQEQEGRFFLVGRVLRVEHNLI